MTEDLVTTDRIVMLCDWLDAGATPTTAEVAQRFGLSHNGAYRLMCRVARTKRGGLFQDQRRWKLMQNSAVASE